MTTPTTRCVHDWLWVGPSGRRLTATAVATHLDNAAGTLRRNGWDPVAFGIYEAVGGDDFQQVSGMLIDFVLADGSGSYLVEYQAWERVSGRTLDEVLGLLVRTAKFVRSQAAGVTA